MVEVRTIPLGGVDYAGNPLPPTGQFYVPGGDSGQGDQAPGQGPGGWGVYTPPAPPQAQGAAPGGEPGNGPGGWATYTPPPPPAPGREIGLGEAGGRGVLDAATFGSYPALAGVAK